MSRREVYFLAYNLIIFYTPITYMSKFLEEKAFCVIRVPSYKIYNFMKAFSNITDGDMFYIEEDKIYVKLMDPSRISLMEVELKMEGFKFY